MKKGVFDILAFETQSEFHSWLKKNHDSSHGIFIRLYKKGSGVKSITYAEALDEALCFGWIDSIVNKFDEKSYIQKFGPRKTRSMWSKINIDNVQRLISAGKMTDFGLAEVESAKADGRWLQAYDSPKNMIVPEEFLNLLAQNEKAKVFYGTLNKTNLYAIGWKIQTAKKEETKLRRMKAIIEQLERGEKFH